MIDVLITNLKNLQGIAENQASAHINSTLDLVEELNRSQLKEHKNARGEVLVNKQTGGATYAPSNKKKGKFDLKKTGRYYSSLKAAEQNLSISVGTLDGDRKKVEYLEDNFFDHKGLTPKNEIIYKEKIRTLLDKSLTVKLNQF